MNSRRATASTQRQESDAYFGLVPFDLTRPEGVERVEEILSVSTDDLDTLVFEGRPKQTLP
jgi:hypothetical protein